METRRGVRSKPNRRFHTGAILLERFEIQIFLSGKRRKAHGIAPSQQSIHSSHSMPDYFTCSTNTKGVPTQSEHPLHHFAENVLLRADVRYVFGERIFLFFLERPGGLEMIVVDKRVHCVMHVTVVSAFQVRDADQIKRNGL